MFEDTTAMPNTEAQAPAGNGKGFKPADLFMNPQGIVMKGAKKGETVEVPLYGQRGLALYVDQQRDPQAKGVLQKLIERSESGEDTELTIKVIVRGKKPEVEAAEIDLDNLF